MPEVVAEQPVEQAQPDAVAETQQAQPAEEVPASAVVEPKEPHPLEPGGSRFKEVYARAKAAEARIQEEREARIRAEAEAQILRETRAVQAATPPDEKVLSWTELKAKVAEGVITEADALEYREKVVAKQAVKTATEQITNKFSQQTRDQRIDAEIGKYKDAIPDVNVLGTDERKKFDAEFRYQVEFAGMDPKSLTTQLAALRAVYGPPDRAAQYAKARSKSAGPESYAETSGSGVPPAQAQARTWIDKLSRHERDHYERMIKQGRYGEPDKAWDNVKTEINEYNKIKGITARV